MPEWGLQTSGRSDSPVTFKYGRIEREHIEREHIGGDARRRVSRDLLRCDDNRD